jgi:hypothetical protein
MRAGKPWNATFSEAVRIQRPRASSSGNSSDRLRSVCGDVGWVARQRDPAKRPLAFAEERADIGGDEARVVERAPSRRAGLGAKAVAVVEDLRAAIEHGQHRRRRGGPWCLAPDPGTPSGPRSAERPLRLPTCQRGHTSWGRGWCLVGDDVDRDVTGDESLEELGGVDRDSDRQRLHVPLGLARQ